MIAQLIFKWLRKNNFGIFVIAFNVNIYYSIFKTTHGKLVPLNWTKQQGRY